HVLLQLEIGDAVYEKPACAVVTIVNGNLVAQRAQLFGGGEPGRTRADNRDMLRAFDPGTERLHPALLPGGIGEELFNRADGHRAVARLLDDATALAQLVLRADTAADLRHVVRGLTGAVGLFEAAFRRQ